MKRIAVFALVLVGVLGCGVALSAQPAKPGGFSRVSVKDKEVRKAADFAVKARAGALQGGGRPASGMELVKILGAEEQVVSGINFRLELGVRVNGGYKRAEAFVWLQQWRKPNPYELTSWRWID